MKFGAGKNLISIHERFMRIRKESRQQVRPRDFWIGVGTVVALLGAMGVYFLQTGHVPEIPSWLWLGMLLLVWGIVLIKILRQGRLVYSSCQIVSFCGFSLLAISQMVPFLHKSSWVGNVGLIILFAGDLWSSGDARNQPAPVPPVDPQCA